MIWGGGGLPLGGGGESGGDVYPIYCLAMTLRRYPLDLVILESEKDPASASGTIKHVKRTKIFSSLGSSDEGEDKSSLEGSSGDCLPSPLLSMPNFSSPTSSISEGGEEQPRSALNSSVGVSNEEDKQKNDGVKLEPLFQRCRFARVRTRFPVPVILWNNKNISVSSFPLFF